MTSTLLLAYHMTADRSYLEPIHSMAAIRLRNLSSRGQSEPGSEAWCAQNMAGFLPDALAKCRFLTGDRQYDPLLRADASGYASFRLAEDRPALVRQLRRASEAFGSNRQAFTSEMRWTDRVMSFTGNYLRYLPLRPPPSPSPDALYMTATGDPGDPLVLPLNAVRWHTGPRQIAALVTDSGPDRFEAELFHFGSQTRAMGAEWFLLKPGPYTVSLDEKETGRQVFSRALQVSGPRTRAEFDLPARRLCVLRVRSAGQ
jgi:hypothetical protein